MLLDSMIPNHRGCQSDNSDTFAGDEEKKEANNLVTPEGILSISLIQMRWRYVVCFVETSYYANMLWSVFHEVVSR